MFTDLLEDELNVSETENGALGFNTTKSALLDMNFKISSYRNKSDKDIEVDFKKAWFENKEYALKFLFYVRDIREGVGERRLFRTCIKTIIEELDERVFNWIAQYGRYDDIFVFVGTSLEDKMYKFIIDTFNSDMINMEDNKPISLLAKWMPSINTSSAETRALAKNLCKAIRLSYKEYRHLLSKMREYIKVLEKKLCANKWAEVDYEKVPSLANLKYKNAFLKHDEDRRREYLGKVTKGEAKINANVAFPHDIVHKYSIQPRWGSSRRKLDETLEGMWKALPDYVKGNSNILVVRDGSGSMTCSIGNTQVEALDVATALAIYFSEHQTGEFKDKFITFSSEPKFINLNNYDNLFDKLLRCYKESECSNTNLEATFDLVLQVAVKNNLKQEEIPNLLIISDMEFDSATTSYIYNGWRATSCNKADKKLFETIAAKYAQYGYKLPKLIFWNVNSRSETIPVKENENGVTLVSGFSPAVTKMVLSDKLDPYEALIDIITAERYNQVTLN